MTSTDADQAASPTSQTPQAPKPKVNPEQIFAGRLGSRLDGKPLNGLICPGPGSGPVSTESEVTWTICSNTPRFICDKCQLVKYCSKKCQVADWPSHRPLCQVPYHNPGWLPAWVVNHRAPVFTTDLPRQPRTAKALLWNRLPPIDILNSTNNEGDVRERDLALCFSALGDLRNVIKTVNSLPDDYTGTCTILLNSLTPTGAARILLLLDVLLSDNPISAAETAIHLAYSASLTPAMADLITYKGAKQLQEAAKTTSQASTSTSPISISRPPLKSVVEGMTHTDTLNQLRAQLSSVYENVFAKASRQDILADPELTDSRDRYLAIMKPAHRTAWLYHSITGIVLPLSACTEHFTEPNRLFFSPKGQWLLHDTDSVLDGWDWLEVIKAGSRHGVPSGDIYGCLFFHLREQYIEFSKRLARFNLIFHATCTPPKLLGHALSDLPFGGRFDRIEVSDLMEEVHLGFLATMQAFGPALHKERKDASIVVAMSDWAPARKDAQVYRAGVAAGKRAEELGKDYLKLDSTEGHGDIRACHAMVMMRVFHDTDAPFHKHLVGLGIDAITKKAKLRLKEKNTIVPKIIGLDLDDQKWRPLSCSQEEFYWLATISPRPWTERYLEFVRLPGAKEASKPPSEAPHIPPTSAETSDVVTDIQPNDTPAPEVAPTS